LIAKTNKVLGGNSQFKSKSTDWSGVEGYFIDFKGQE
jgi:hypothetical protein